MRRHVNDNCDHVAPVSLAASFDDAGRFGFILPVRNYSGAELKTLAEVLSCLAGGVAEDLTEATRALVTTTKAKSAAVFVYINGWSALPGGIKCPRFGVQALDEV